MEPLKGIVCTASGKEVANLVNSDPSGAIFDWNVRQFLGLRGFVNKAIMSTCSKINEDVLFWFMNNGITIVGDKIEAIPDPDKPVVKIDNVQIVNGCQTASVLAIANQQGSLSDKVEVLLRIYETGQGDLVDKIVESTNTQNRITSRNLKANEGVQTDLERAFREYGYYYERKPCQYDRNPSVPVDRILSNETVGQSYLAVVLRQPSDASRRKYKVWDEMYNAIFAGGAVQPYIICTLIWRQTRDWLVSSKFARSKRDVPRKLAKNGSFHIARMAAYFLLGDDNWHRDPAELDSLHNKIQKTPLTLEQHLAESFDVLCRIIRKNPEYKQDIDRALKSSALDQNIDRVIYKRTVVPSG